VSRDGRLAGRDGRLARLESGQTADGRAIARVRDGGFATVWIVAAIAVVVAAAAVSISVGVATLERHRAAAAADAVALATALDAIQGPTAACSDGDLIGRLDGAVLTRCVVAGSVADVQVAVSLPGPLAALGPAIGRARAGPASELSGP
jgi:secretion/DNA translocation related TadE-like protein